MRAGRRGECDASSRSRHTAPVMQTSSVSVKDRMWDQTAVGMKGRVIEGGREGEGAEGADESKSEGHRFLRMHLPQRSPSVFLPQELHLDIIMCSSFSHKRGIPQLDSRD